MGSLFDWVENDSLSPKGPLFDKFGLSSFASTSRTHVTLLT